jgi:DNA adenine methylase
VKPILKYPGAKWKLANWIIEQMPKHHVYLEPYFGSGAVLFNKEPSKIETINDINDDIINFFKVCREHPNELATLINLTPWAKEEYNNSYIINNTDSDIEKARKFMVRCWQAFSTRTGYKTGWRHSAQGQCSSMPELWNKLPDRIFQVADRLKHVQIEHMDAIQLIKRYNAENVLIYCDPPYITSTRQEIIYQNEMSNEDHENLLDALLLHKGKVILSGYDNELYNTKLKEWRIIHKSTSVENGGIREEVLWINF